MSWTPRVCQLLDLSSEVKKMEWGPGGPEAGVLGVGSVGWTAARVRCGLNFSFNKLWKSPNVSIEFGYAWNDSPRSDIHKIPKYNKPRT
jgi:hypothetical protein